MVAILKHYIALGLLLESFMLSQMGNIKDLSSMRLTLCLPMDEEENLVKFGTCQNNHRGGLDDDLSLGSNTDIRSPDGIINHDPFKDAQDLSTRDNAGIKLVEEEEDNVHPPIERQVLLPVLYLNSDISLNKESKIFEIVKMAKNKGTSIILVHEQDVGKGGCPFSLIIKKTSTSSSSAS